MNSPYENIIIGSFLYGLGLAMGAQPLAAPSCVNLMQQTPLDPVLGDVMVQLPGVWRLIEFKRKQADLTKEIAKLLLVRGALKNRPRLERVSRKVHWYVESDAAANDASGPIPSLTLEVRQYLDLLDPATPAIQLNEFAESMVREAFETPDASLVHEDRYLKLITLLHGRRDFNTSGLLVGVSSAGGLTYVPVPNFADLRGTASMLRNYMHEQWKLMQELKERRFEPEQHRALERGFEKAPIQRQERELGSSL